MEEKINTIKRQLVEAAEQRQPLKIIGGNSKAFLGRSIAGTPVELSKYNGIISYEPTELFMTARAGTLLSEINRILAEQGQMLAFDPPQLNENTTIGGTVAAGLSGPRRPYSGAVRDHVLGIRCINGLGKDLAFGGQVMKNVAGYDLSRLMTGAYGTLGVILDVSLKVMPLPELEMTYYSAMSVDSALTKMTELAAQSIPLSATCYSGDTLFVRLSGNESAVKDAARHIELDEYIQGETFWDEWRDFKSPLFNSRSNIWRISVPNTARLDMGDEPFLIDWGGGVYWLSSERPAKDIFNLASNVGGSAMLFRGGNHSDDVFQPLNEDLLNLHKRLKHAFDPHGILNTGKMYATL